MSGLSVQLKPVDTEKSRYPINDARNEALYRQYEELAAQEGDVVFAGRLGGYKYYDMDKAIAAAFQLVRNELGVEPTEA